jgi:glycosyltransferase involved in cell wall biosynthesis
MPKVSIVLPNYNYARYLDERIQSILNQTYTDFELIIADDASTDNSLEVIDQYTGDSRVKTMFFTENSGLPYKRWNDGSAQAEGEYILFAGADDSCHPTLLERLVEKMDANPSVGIAYTQSLEIDGEGNPIRTLNVLTDNLDKERWKHDYVETGKNECCYMLIRNTIPNASAVMLKRQKFEEVGRFDEASRLVADWILWSKMLLVSDIAYIAEPLNYFRTHGTTVRSRTQSDGLHVLEEVKVVAMISESAAIPQEYLDRAYNRIVNRWVNSTVRLAVTKPDIVLKRVREIHGIVSKVDPKVNQRLFKRVVKDVSTLGLLTLRERTFRR